MADAEAAVEPQAEATPEGVAVQDAELPEAAGGGGGGDGQIGILLDTTVPVDVSLGKLEMPVRDILQLGAGSVLKLDKQAGEPVDLYLRGVRFATGHLVVVGQRLGVRIKEIIRENG